MKKEHEVFISYKTEEQGEARKVKDFLESNGIKCWMAPESISGGMSYAGEITRAIRSCKFFVLILSQKSQQSPQVLRELAIANEDKNITIMPFIIQKVELSDDLSYFLSIIQQYKAYENKKDAMNRMLADMKAKLPKEEVLEQQIVEKPAKVKKIPKPKKAKAPKKVLYSVLGGIAGFILLMVLIGQMNKVTIAGEVYKKSASSVYIDNAELTEKDMQSLEKMKKAYIYSFENCKFPGDDLSGVFNEEAYMLKLINCNLTDESLATIGLEKMTALNSLDLSSNNTIKKWDFLVNLNNLEELYLANNGISDISFLKDYAVITTLNLSGNKLTSLDALKNLSTLKMLNVNQNQLTSLKGLETNLELNVLRAGYNKLSSLEGLENATLLEEVFLKENELTDISMLEKSVETLEKLYVNRNAIADLSVLKDCVNLTYLNVSENDLSSLDFLKDCTKLKGISAESNKLESAAGLENCVQLTYIDLSGNVIEDTTALMGIQNEKGDITLNLSGNKITELQLAGAENYNSVNVHGNNISSLTALEGNKASKLIFDYNESIDFEKLGQSETFKYYIFDCPLDKQVSVGESLNDFKVIFVDAASLEGTTLNTYLEAVEGEGENAI